jgi:hypothetical protein
MLAHAATREICTTALSLVFGIFSLLSTFLVNEQEIKSMKQSRNRQGHAALSKPSSAQFLMTASWDYIVARVWISRDGAVLDYEAAGYH